MTTFDNREKGYEGAFAHKETIGFALEAKASKIFGLLIAEKLGLEGEPAELYAQDVVAANLEEPGFDDVIRKVKKDLREKGVEISDETLNAELDIALAKAKEIMDNG